MTTSWNKFVKQHKGKGKSMKKLSCMYKKSRSIKKKSIKKSKSCKKSKRSSKKKSSRVSKKNKRFVPDEFRKLNESSPCRSHSRPCPEYCNKFTGTGKHKGEAKCAVRTMNNVQFKLYRLKKNDNPLQETSKEEQKQETSKEEQKQEIPEHPITINTTTILPQ